MIDNDRLAKLQERIVEDGYRPTLALIERILRAANVPYDRQELDVALRQWRDLTYGKWQAPDGRFVGKLADLPSAFDGKNYQELIDNWAEAL